MLPGLRELIGRQRTVCDRQAGNCSPTAKSHSVSAQKRRQQRQRTARAIGNGKRAGRTERPRAAGKRRVSRAASWAGASRVRDRSKGNGNERQAARTARLAPLGRPRLAASLQAPAANPIQYVCAFARLLRPLGIAIRCESQPSRAAEFLHCKLQLLLLPSFSCLRIRVVCEDVFGRSRLQAAFAFALNAAARANQN